MEKAHLVNRIESAAFKPPIFFELLIEHMDSASLSAHHTVTSFSCVKELVLY